MERVTRKDVEKAFEMFCQVMGKRIAERWNDEGAWRLDYAAEYGGYCIDEILDHGVTRPLTHERFPAREFRDMLFFAAATLRYKETTERDAALSS